MSNSLWPHGLQHTRLPCPSLSPRVCSGSCPLSWWCYLTISSSTSLSPFAFSLPQHQGLFQWASSSHHVAKVLELQLQHQSFQWIFSIDFFRIDQFDLLDSQGTLERLLQHHNLKTSVLQHSTFLMVQLSLPYMTTGKTRALTTQTFVGKELSAF